MKDGTAARRKTEILFSLAADHARRMEELFGLLTEGVPGAIMRGASRDPSREADFARPARVEDG